MSYRVYVTSHIRGLFDEDVYDYRVDYLPNYSLGQIDKLIKDLNNSGNVYIGNNSIFKWESTDNYSSTIGVSIDIIDNQTGISVTPKRWEFITKT